MWSPTSLKSVFLWKFGQSMKWQKMILHVIDQLVLMKIWVIVEAVNPNFNHNLVLWQFGVASWQSCAESHNRPPSLLYRPFTCAMWLSIPALDTDVFAIQLFSWIVSMKYNVRCQILHVPPMISDYECKHDRFSSSAHVCDKFWNLAVSPLFSSMGHLWAEFKARKRYCCSQINS
jgi:hypothetical protein